MTQDTWACRPATIEDVRTVAALAAEIWHEYYGALLSLEQIVYMVDKFQSPDAIADQISEQGYEYYLMRADGADVGYLAVKAEDGKLFLSKLYVLKAHRGRGYASSAMAFLIRLCRERGLGAVWLTVNRHNDASIAVYEKKGFRKVREQVADIGNGYVMDDFIMEKAIGETDR
ncbi:GNAT family N-acetyltransferase [Cohnella rhizosphaerae]|uniref:GNAT family N-acetyltransferase n=1 Tax=Cohnella rhizosphaerae TaxID=1457232 RepID=A0A9X4KUN8_9BACL|nr:GNAT family N-acetyltransferase [Cohnella rhizosphaerae]MDG0811380.1 GNAT family N-acetyltransferase [Cohnella rhizosphaerae]